MTARRAMAALLRMALWTTVAFSGFTAAMAEEPVQRLQRATGLWKITPETSPFSWDICVDHAKDRLIDDDLWSDFEKECRIGSQQRDGDRYGFTASCPGAELTGKYAGNLDKAYTLTGDVTFQVNGKTEVQHHVLKASFEGECPADLRPGEKKMRGGMVMKSLYINR